MNDFLTQCLIYASVFVGILFVYFIDLYTKDRRINVAKTLNQTKQNKPNKSNLRRQAFRKKHRKI